MDQVKHAFVDDYLDSHPRPQERDSAAIREWLLNSEFSPAHANFSEKAVVTMVGKVFEQMVYLHNQHIGCPYNIDHEIWMMSQWLSRNRTSCYAITSRCSGSDYKRLADFLGREMYNYFSNEPILDDDDLKQLKKWAEELGFT